MEFRFNVTGPERKRLAQTAAETLGVKAKYLGMPTCAYEIGCCEVDKEGAVTFAEGADSETVERVLEALLNEGFECETPAAAEEGGPREHGLTITLPLNGMDEAAVDRLCRLIAGKSALIRKALGAARLDVVVEREMDRISFPWFDRAPSFEEIEAVSAFMNALCRMAKESTRVNATEKEVESEKYAFRGFLLRLGFIGADSKAVRKTLMKNLSGSAAFPSKEAADAFSAARKAKRDAAKGVTE